MTRVALTLQPPEGLIVYVGDLVVVQGQGGQPRQALEVPGVEPGQLVVVHGEGVQLVQACHRSIIKLPLNTIQPTFKYSSVKFCYFVI